MASEFEELWRTAWRVRSNAYVPYSNYPVGAALLSSDGKIWSGCNVENVSFGLTMCAERNAIFQMVAGGSQSIRSVVVATKDGATPCGACRQVLAEFAESPDIVIVCGSEDGQYSEFTLEALFPDGFSSQAVRRTDDPVGESY